MLVVSRASKPQESSEVRFLMALKVHGTLMSPKQKTQKENYLNTSNFY